MACGPCAARAAAAAAAMNGAGSWVFKASDGTETVKPTEIEARAMLVRAKRKGETGEVYPKAT